MDKDRFERFLARAEHLADLTGYNEIAEAERERRIAEIKGKVAPFYLRALYRMFFGETLKQARSRESKILPSSEKLLKDWQGWLAVIILCGWLVALLGMMIAIMVYLPSSILPMMILYSLTVVGLWGANLFYSFRLNPEEADRKVIVDIGAVLLLPGWAFYMLLVVWAIHQYDQPGEVLDAGEMESRIAGIKALPAGALVRDFAADEIDRIKDEVLSPTSDLVQAEGTLQARLNEADAVRQQLRHRLGNAGRDREGALKKGLEVADERCANLSKTLRHHRDVMARARAILDECRASAQGLSEAVADAEILRNLEEQALQDEQHIALSEQAVENAVGRLRQRVMSLEGALAQLNSKRLVVTDNGDVEQQAYLERIETVAGKLAAI